MADADLKPLRCSACEKLREADTNHWWVIRQRADGTIHLLPWNAVLARRPGAVLACGLNCVLKLAGRLAHDFVLKQAQQLNAERSAAVSDAVVAQDAPTALVGGPEAVDLSGDK